MKKILLAILLLIVGFTLFACEVAPEKPVDDDKTEDVLPKEEEEDEVEDEVEDEIEDEVEDIIFTTVMKYLGEETAGFEKDEEANNANLVELDEDVFELKGTLAGDYKNPIGLNKDGSIRLYSVRQTGIGNRLTLKIAEEYTITKLTITFLAPTGNKTNEGVIFINGEEFDFDKDITLNGGVLTIEEDMNVFELFNAQIDGDKNGQIWVGNIEIEYKN